MREKKDICVIEICCSASCRIHGYDDLREMLKGILGIGVGEETEDGCFALKEAPCFGACDASPSLRVNGEIYGPLNTEEEVCAVIRSLVSSEKESF